MAVGGGCSVGSQHDKQGGTITVEHGKVILSGNRGGAFDKMDSVGVVLYQCSVVSGKVLVLTLCAEGRYVCVETFTKAKRFLLRFSPRVYLTRRRIVRMRGIVIIIVMFSLKGVWCGNMEINLGCSRGPSVPLIYVILREYQLHN